MWLRNICFVFEDVLDLLAASATVCESSSTMPRFSFRTHQGPLWKSLHIAPLNRKRQIDNLIKTRKQQKWS